MVLFVVLLGVIVALAGSLLFSPNRTPDETAAVDVAPQQIDGLSLRVSGDPAQRVILLTEQSGNQLSVQVPTSAPAQTQSETAQQAPTNTPVPVATATAQIIVATPTNTAVPVQIQQNNSTAEPIIFIDYTIQPNDTLYNIATRRMDSSIALISRFGLSSDDIIQGAVIKLPVGNPAYCPGRRPYAIGEGDTAYSIAKRYGTTHQNLQAINGLNSEFAIRIGEILCVP